MALGEKLERTCDGQRELGLQRNPTPGSVYPHLILKTPSVSTASMELDQNSDLCEW